MVYLEQSFPERVKVYEFPAATVASAVHKGEVSIIGSIRHMRLLVGGLKQMVIGWSVIIGKSTCIVLIRMMIRT